MLELQIDKREEKILLRKINALPEKLFTRVVSKAVNFAMTPVLKSAKKKVPVDEGVLKKSLLKKRKVYRRSHIVWQGVGAKRGMAPHAWLVEHGHRLKGGGFVPAKPFLRPAFEENKAKVLQRYRDKLKQGVLLEAKKA